jgi:protein arginine N-methyltransferase 7
MASKAGAQHVYAFEMFPAMAAVAATVTAVNTGADGGTCADAGAGAGAGMPSHPLNDFSEPMCGITVIAKKSTDVDVDDGVPLCDILVTEIFDSVLLGEGVLPTLSHAWRHLLQPDAVIVPQSGNEATLPHTPFDVALHCDIMPSFAPLGE